MDKRHLVRWSVTLLVLALAGTLVATGYMRARALGATAAASSPAAKPAGAADAKPSAAKDGATASRSALGPTSRLAQRALGQARQQDPDEGDGGAAAAAADDKTWAGAGATQGSSSGSRSADGVSAGSQTNATRGNSAGDDGDGFASASAGAGAGDGNGEGEQGASAAGSRGTGTAWDDSRSADLQGQSGAARAYAEGDESKSSDQGRTPPDAQGRSQLGAQTENPLRGNRPRAALQNDETSQGAQGASDAAGQPRRFYDDDANPKYGGNAFGSDGSERLGKGGSARSHQSEGSAADAARGDTGARVDGTRSVPTTGNVWDGNRASDNALLPPDRSDTLARSRAGAPAPAGRFDPFADDGGRGASADAPTGEPARHAFDAIPARSAAGLSRGYGAGVEGQGEPGSRQLEGPQTPALSIIKVAPAEVQVGKPATFEIRVKNAGQFPATGVEVHDAVPRGTQYVGSNPAADPGPNGELLWQMGTLKPGEEQVIKLELMPVAEGEIGSVARVTFTAEASMRTVSTRPDLKLEVTAPREVLIGQAVMMRIKIWNPGTGPATGVVISEQIPDGLQHPQGPVLEYEIGSLKPNEVRDLELTLQAAKPGMIENVLLARGDGTLRAESKTQLQIVAPELQVGINGPHKRYLERPANYTIQVGNPGTAPAKDIELVTYLPKGMKFVKADGFGQYDAKTNAVYWSLEELPPSQRGSVTLSLLPTDQGMHTLAVEASAKMSLFHRQEHTVEVDGVAAVLFEVSDLEDPIDVDGETTYEIRVVNQGSKAATEIEIVADFPPELKPAAAEGPSRHAISGTRVVFERLPRLAPRADVTYKIRAQGIRAGDARVRVMLSSAELTTPVTNEESTRVFADE